MKNLILFASQIDLNSLPNVGATNGSIVTTIITIVSGIVGAICLLFITIGGFRYILSQGDPQGVAKAKGTIIYALIGLSVVILAQVIVRFVIGAVT